MRKLAEITYEGIEEDKKYKEIVDKIYEACFKEEDLYDYSVYVSVILSNAEYIQKINSKYRNIDKVTDVLSFPMFEKEEIETAKKNKEVLGDIIICIPKVEEQAKEYEHSITREFAYMLVHGFYHLMGYDHITDEEKEQMREKEECILKKVGFERNNCRNER
ncbi:MAG: rRNA maturation RNase YbeY [Clostridia bacterium]|nr:rRNA maturation RNase YbeY [Clostridia bacterium]